MKAAKTIPLLAVIALLALALAACGGGGSDETATTEATSSTGSGASPQAREGSEIEAEGGSEAEEGADAETKPSPAEAEAADEARTAKPASLATDPGSIRGARVTATGAVQTVPPEPSAQEEAMENSYSSIKAFGTEAEGSEATDITYALVQYLTAKAQGDWATACARIYSVLRGNLESEGHSCPETYGAMMERGSRAASAEAAKIDVASVRRGEGNRAFVIYKTPDVLSADMPMYLDGGVWTVGALEAYVLTPEQLAQNQG